MAKKPSTDRMACRNKKASFKFEWLEKLECGIVLRGTEVKSLRVGQASLEEAYARIEDDELWMIGFHIPPYEHGNVQNHDPTRRRKLLLHRREISRLGQKVVLRGLTLVPLDVHFNERGLAKVTLALARGKTTHDKRQVLQKRDAQREMDRAMRRR